MIIIVVGALYLLGIFHTEKELAIRENCVEECGRYDLELDNWRYEDNCVVCRCYEDHNINCKIKDKRG